MELIQREIESKIRAEAVVRNIGSSDTIIASYYQILEDCLIGLPYRLNKQTSVLPWSELSAVFPTKI